MRTSSTGISLIKHFEGFSGTPYRCPAGYLTIGYGHVMRNDAPKTVDELLAEQLLASDLMLAEAAIGRLITRPLSQNQFDALASFTYNLGAGALQRSTLRRRINRGAFDDVPAQFARWVFTGGKRLPGLIRRRKAEAGLFIKNSAINGI